MKLLLERTDNDYGLEWVVFFYNNAKAFGKSSYFILAITNIWSSSTLFLHLLNIGELITCRIHRPFKFFKRITTIVLVILLMLAILFIYFMIIGLTYFFGEYRIIFGLIMYVFLPLMIIILFNFIAIPRKLVKADAKGIIFTFFYSFFVIVGFSAFLRLTSNFKAIYGVFSIIITLIIGLYLICQGIIIGIIYNIENYQ